MKLLFELLNEEDQKGSVLKRSVLKAKIKKILNNFIFLNF